MNTGYIIGIDFGGLETSISDIVEIVINSNETNRWRDNADSYFSKYLNKVEPLDSTWVKEGF